MKDLLKNWLGGGASPSAGKSALRPPPAAVPSVAAPAGPPAPGATDAYARHSHGLEQFLSSIRSDDPLRILDAGGLNQANVAFLTSLGHRLYSEELLRSWDDAVRARPGVEMPELTAAFVRDSLGFAEASLDGVLLWDVLEFLPHPLLGASVERLYSICKPGAYLLAFFHADEKAAEVPTYSYRIQDAATLELARRQMRRPASLFNNRSVEKLFQQFQSVKFFLTRDHLREVIVRR